MVRREYFSVLIDDRLISFNVNRTLWDRKIAKRRVVLHIPPDVLKKVVIIPGIKEETEKKLLKHIKYETRRQAKEASFTITPHTFSLMWRFVRNFAFIKKKVGINAILDPLDGETKKNIEEVTAEYRRKVESRLVPGAVFVYPDSELTFKNPNRIRKPYSRYVLIFSCPKGKVIIMPFTSKTKNIESNFDVLFDSSCQSTDLRPEAYPAIVNSCNVFFSKRIVLKVNMAQPVDHRHFILNVLEYKGKINNQVLASVQYRVNHKKTNSNDKSLNAECLLKKFNRK